jgi:protein-S-isoprenylcysteine O-methyltransferase Ste14
MQLLTPLADYWQSFGAFALFALLHSLCAREPFKHVLARFTSVYFVRHFWRFIYNALSYGALYYWIAVLHWGHHPDANVWLIDYPQPLWRTLLLLHLCSIGLFYVAFLQSDFLEFLGLKQMWRAVQPLRGAPAAALRLFGSDRLEVSGIYGWLRHPMLAAGFLFIATSGPSQNNLVFLLMYTIYMLVGGYYEERRLVRIFGQQYLDYRQQVGAFFPRLRYPPISAGR